jgi:predicted membrane chloride channel (bestrophin family)
MIQYEAGPFGLNVLWRLHGSAVFKSIVPAIISTIIYALLFETTGKEDEILFLHPYPIIALIAALTFLLSYRATFAYNRYWEACSAVYQMHSRWMDVGTALAAFHLQSSKYKGRKPPSFGHYPHLRVLERERERLNEPTLDELEEQLLDVDKNKTPSTSLRSRIGRTFRRTNERDTEHDRALYPSMKVPIHIRDDSSTSSLEFDAVTVNKIETRKIGKSIDINTEEPALFCK